MASFAVLTDGTVWTWGSSKRGQLGLGPDVVHALKPQRIPGLEGITEMSAGWGHACALRGSQASPNVHAISLISPSVQATAETCDINLTQGHTDKTHTISTVPSAWLQT